MHCLVGIPVPANHRNADEGSREEDPADPAQLVGFYLPRTAASSAAPVRPIGLCPSTTSSAATKTQGSPSRPGSGARHCLLLEAVRGFLRLDQKHRGTFHISPLCVLEMIMIVMFASGCVQSNLGHFVRLPVPSILRWIGQVHQRFRPTCLVLGQSSKNLATLHSRLVVQGNLTVVLDL